MNSRHNGRADSGMSAEYVGMPVSAVIIVMSIPINGTASVWSNNVFKLLGYTWKNDINVNHMCYII